MDNGRHQNPETAVILPRPAFPVSYPESLVTVFLETAYTHCMTGNLETAVILPRPAFPVSYPEFLVTIFLETAYCTLHDRKPFVITPLLHLRSAVARCKIALRPHTPQMPEALDHNGIPEII